jgi:putative tryptophan/tyrosine transport system substrate-binding protein
VSARRRLVLAIGVTALATPLIALAQQQPRVARIGYLAGNSLTDNRPGLQTFRDGLHELGYVEGKNLVIEYRWAEGHYERLPGLAAELVRLPVDVIVAVGDPVVFAAKQATSTIPIVMTSVGDPVAREFVVSLARPGGNVTGVSNFAVTLMGKWLELLKEILPTLSQVAVLRNAANPTHPLFWMEAQSAAPRLGLKLQDVEVRSSADLDEAFGSVVRSRSGAVVVVPDPLLAGVAEKRIAELAMRNGVPTMCTFKEQAEVGGLMSYGPDVAVNAHHAAGYVDKILKGAKPADLPVEQPTKFELFINLKTAKALGITIPQSVLLRADEVIE